MTEEGYAVKKIRLILLAAAVVLCATAALADPDVPEATAAPQVQSDEAGDPSRVDLSRFSIPRIHAPVIPQIEVPEVPEIEVPEIHTPAPTQKPKIEVPEIPEVERAELEAPAATPDAWPQVDEALEALGIDAYRALYDALSAGETVGEGSRGDAARGLQQMLVAFGQKVAVDGIVGPKTIAALKAVQAQYGLPPSEKLDAADLATLLPLLLTAGQSE